ncbi:MAG TPA: S8 family serine peptidase [Mycobacteriales bacterium]|jgi:hypothetical protein
MPRHALAVLLAVLAFGPAAEAAPRPAPRPTVVVAVADTGINPYHEVFRRPRNTRHPCTYVPGFTDCSIPALRLSIGKYRDYRQAVAADRAVWESVEPDQWYWIPGTNIIGAVCDHEYTSLREPTPPPDPDVPGSSTCVLDNNGHGTATASAVLSEEPDALLLVHEGDAAAAAFDRLPVRPDVQSHSWGPPSPIPFQLAEPVLESNEICPDAVRRPETLYFLAAGNEGAFPTILDCARHVPDVHVVGGGYPGSASTGSWTVYDFASWYCRPVASSESRTGQESMCGTSVAAPTAAGAAAGAILRIRRAERYTGRSTRTHVSRTVTRERFEEALRRGASYAPKAKFPPQAGVLPPSVPVPEQAAYLFWGYGWLDSTVVDTVVSCAFGRACPAKSAEAQAYNDARQQARRSQEMPDGPLLPQEDAGSGRDAGNDPYGAVPIAAGRAYDARIEPHGQSGDIEDWYAVRLRAGQAVTVTTTGYLHPRVPVDVTPVSGCWFLVAPDGELVGVERGLLPLRNLACDSASPNTPPTNVRVPRTGTYSLVYSSHNGVPHDYRFTLSLGR